MKNQVKFMLIALSFVVASSSSLIATNNAFADNQASTHSQALGHLVEPSKAKATQHMNSHAADNIGNGENCALNTICQPPGGDGGATS